MSKIHRRGVLRSLGALAVGSGISACAGPAPTPLRKFYLGALDGAPPGVGQADWSLVVDPPRTVPALNNDRIAQVIGENEFDYYADARWGDVAPIMMQTVILRSFTNSGAFAAVESERARIRPDFRLQSTLFPFYGSGALGEAPVARVGIGAELVRSSGREIVASTKVEESAAADAPGIDALVGAFDQASQAAVATLLAWAVRAGNAA